MDPLSPHSTSDQSLTILGQTIPYYTIFNFFNSIDFEKLDMKKEGKEIHTLCNNLKQLQKSPLYDQSSKLLCSMEGVMTRALQSYPTLNRITSLAHKFQREIKIAKTIELLEQEKIVLITFLQSGILETLGEMLCTPIQRELEFTQKNNLILKQQREKNICTIVSSQLQISANQVKVTQGEDGKQEIITISL